MKENQFNTSKKAEQNWVRYEYKKRLPEIDKNELEYLSSVLQYSLKDARNSDDMYRDSSNEMFEFEKNYKKEIKNMVENLQNCEIDTLSIIKAYLLQFIEYQDQVFF
jgi:hypothetical protein